MSLSDHVRIREPRILTLDIESSPNIADVWGLYNQNISLAQLRETQSVICFAAKWLGTKKVEFYSDHHDGHDVMVKMAHELLSRADVVVTFNGDAYDFKHLNREFWHAGLPKPDPYKSFDLYKQIRGQFKHASNKLDHIAQQIGVGSKLAHSGHTLWVRCMAGDDKAWNTMRRYNKQDVVVTEGVFLKLRENGWVKNPPHMGLYNGNPTRCCPSCGSTDLVEVGETVANQIAYRAYRCASCRLPVRGNEQKHRVQTRGIA